MNLAQTIRIFGGGPGSGCQGPNCGRKSEGKSLDWKERPITYPDKTNDVFRDAVHDYVAGTLGIDVTPDQISKAFIEHEREFPIDKAVDTQGGSFDAQQVAKYINDIKEGKPFEAITLALVGGKAYVVDGHHRIDAAKHLGLKTIPASVVDIDDEYDNLYAGLYAGGPGSGCHGPNCGRKVSNAITDLLKRTKASPADINHGQCKAFAKLVKQQVPSAKIYKVGQGYHYFIQHEGKYFDASRPNGVDDWRKLPVIKEAVGWGKNWTPRVHAGGLGSGCHGPNCGRPGSGVKLSPRAQRAIASFKPLTADKLRTAKDNEFKVAQALGGEAVINNRPFDVIIEHRRIGIEVKTLIEKDVNDKITQHPSGRLRKEAYARKNGLKKTFMVALDHRGCDHGSDCKPVIYVKPGIGAYRLSAMLKVNGLTGLRKAVLG